MVLYRIIRWFYIEPSNGFIYNYRAVRCGGLGVDMEMGRRAGWSPWPSRWLEPYSTAGMWILVHGAGATGGKLHWLRNDTGEVIAFCLTGVNADGRDHRKLFAYSSYPELAYDWL